ncbi:hypothetical protein CEV08_00815 [Bartonella tribocorum]|uniref:Uncharacterized protein n=1 Tax=Bartonella tribocorum TaxID=85701 RepID=A0A2M6UY78_9HYPH|nr:hypothetical protein CEV08_00815 [Bartonella tribocorum]
MISWEFLMALNGGNTAFSIWILLPKITFLNKTYNCTFKKSFKERHFSRVHKMRIGDFSNLREIQKCFQ